DNNDYLFYKIIRNKTLFNVILYHLKLFNKYSIVKETLFGGMEKINNFEYREYIGKLIFVNYRNHLSENTIPNTLSNLKFGYLFDSELRIGDIPPSVETFHMGRRYMGEILPGVIPASVKKLKLSSLFNKQLSIGSIPESVTCLHFNDHYNRQLSIGIIPNNVVKLTLSKSFNQILNVGDLPQSLTYLKFGWCWNQKIERNSIPPKVETLIFGSYFLNKCQPLLPGDLPFGLKHLELGHSFKHVTLMTDITSIFFEKLPLKESLIRRPSTIPSSVTFLKIGNEI
ncbi:hypothetical protein DICPUDRAFT_19530, partial [Dictyostelium purpureum]